MGIERYVASKWNENVSKSDKWGPITKKDEVRLEKMLGMVGDLSMKQHSMNNFVVTINW
jgi:hypothetical protein